jgi:hypothetical protein
LYQYANINKQQSKGTLKKQVLRLVNQFTHRK